MLSVGTKAPDFELNSTPDQKLKLSQLLGKNVILAFFGQPGLTGDVELDLVQEHLNNLRGEVAHETIGEGTVLVLEGAGELRRIAVSSVEAAERSICPFFCLPPLAPFPFLLVLGHRVLGNLEIDDLEEQPTPRD